MNIIITRFHRYTSCNVNVIKAAALISLSSLLFITPVLAQESSAPAITKPITQQRIDTRIQKIDTSRIASREANLQQKMQILEQRRLTEASKSALFRKRLEQRKVMVASHEAQIRVKIQAFKDKQKAEIASRVNTNLNKINQNQTDAMLRNLDLMSSLLDKLTERVNLNSPDIKDPAAANQAIADAREVIATAKTAVEAQAQKDYTITVTTEAKIRSDAQAKRDQLFKDIMVTRKLVIDAKQAVSSAVRITKSGVKEATASGQQ